MNWNIKDFWREFRRDMTIPREEIPSLVYGVSFIVAAAVAAALLIVAVIAATIKAVAA